MHCYSFMMNDELWDIYIHLHYHYDSRIIKTFNFIQDVECSSLTQYIIEV